MKGIRGIGSPKPGAVWGCYVLRHFVRMGPNRQPVWLMQCQVCETVQERVVRLVMWRNARNCKYCQSTNSTDKTGQVFGNVTVMTRDTDKPIGRDVWWVVKCTCGETFSIRSYQLKADRERYHKCKK